MTKNKGVALILTVIILTAVLAIALTAGKVFTDKIKMSRNTSDSMKAYYAAESRIECELYKLQHAETDCAAQHPDTEAEIGVDYIKAIGKAGDARRGIEVALAAAGGITAIGVVIPPGTDSAISIDQDCKDGGYTASTGLYAASNTTETPLRLIPGNAKGGGFYGYSVQCYK